MSLTREQNLKRGEIDFPFYLGEFLAQVDEAETHLDDEREVISRKATCMKA